LTIAAWLREVERTIAMITALENPRYERKFVTDTLTVSEVLAMVRRHPAAFREVFPARRVNNLYLDSHDLRDYYDHINGVSHRKKTRVRWYGTPSGAIGAPTLEHKIKRGLVGGKVSHRLPPVPVNGHVARADLEAALDRAHLPGFTRLSLRHLQPALANSYWRRYFLSADRRFRLTVDFNLEFALARQADADGLGPRLTARTVVVELKFSLDEADGADYITNALPLRLARCSKYVLGISSLAAC
jgi:hypothetical protein